MSLRDADVWYFDCDGVLLDSNAAKTEAFRRAAAPYGAEIAERLVTYHLATGGVSRQVKAQYLFDELLGRPPEPEELERFFDLFAAAAQDGLRAAALDESAVELLTELRSAGRRAYVVTGGSQVEVRNEFERRGIAHLFDGIHGNPRPKHAIVAALVEEIPKARGVFVGDGSLDAQVAEHFGLQFVFVRHWTEWADAEASLPTGSVTVDDLGELRGRWSAS